MNVGDKVVCINDTWDAWVFDTYNALPEKGEIYTIRSIRAGRPQLDGGAAVLTLLLEELENDIDYSHVGGDELGFRANRFAPLNSMKARRALEEKSSVPSGL
ncbi:MAG: hypothetical protein KGS60_13180 [Verrucomicrobia bacterium]|nr:hypothetical protein [Verrucomicrobiota bacterium]